MADIIIKKSASGFGNSNETSVEITGADYINDGLVTAILDRMNGEAGHGCQCSEEDTERPEQTDVSSDYASANSSLGFAPGFDI